MLHPLIGKRGKNQRGVLGNFERKRNLCWGSGSEKLGRRVVIRIKCTRKDFGRYGFDRDTNRDSTKKKPCVAEALEGVLLSVGERRIGPLGVR